MSAHLVTLAVPVLSFFAGIYFQRWMRDRVSMRRPARVTYSVSPKQRERVS